MVDREIYAINDGNLFHLKMFVALKRADLVKRSSNNGSTNTPIQPVFKGHFFIQSSSIALTRRTKQTARKSTGGKARIDYCVDQNRLGSAVAQSWRRTVANRLLIIRSSAMVMCMRL